MIEYKTQKKERYFFEVIRLYTELDYSIGHISRIFPLSYGTVKRWLSIFAEEERKFRYKSLFICQWNMKNQDHSYLYGVEVSVCEPQNKCLTSF